MNDPAVKPSDYRCTECRKWLPASAFYPSTISEEKRTAKCRACTQEYGRRRRVDAASVTAGRLAAAFGDGEWTSLQAANVIKHNPLGMGAVVRGLCDLGFAERVGEKRYRLVNAGVTPTAAPVTPAQPETPPPPKFFSVGPYTIASDRIVLVETLDDGRVDVVFDALEHRPQGYVANMRLVFGGPERDALWQALGGVVVNAKGQIERLEAERDRALEQALEYERKYKELDKRVKSLFA